MKKLIAVVDDEPDILNLVTLHLKRAGYEVAGFLNGDQFYAFLENKIPDLLILDLMLPDIDGFEICKHIKKNNEWEDIPIIMLTAKEDETDKVLGLELGADDYVTKPFSPRELVARVKAVLRRKATEPKTVLVEINDVITIDSDKHEVKLLGKKIDLTSTEFKILYFLASKPGWVFSRDKILDYLWGQEKAVIDRTIDVHIRHLREKLGKYGNIIKNVRGIGYKLEK